MAVSLARMVAIVKCDQFLAVHLSPFGRDALIAHRRELFERSRNSTRQIIFLRSSFLQTMRFLPVRRSAWG